MELSEISSLPEKSARDLPRVINHMLGQVFLYRDKEDDKDDYYFVHRNRSACESALKLTGFTLLHDDYHSIFQVVSEFSYCRSHYKLDETLMILVLRKLYEEHSERLSLAQDPVVTIGEVRDEYRTITGKERDLGIIQNEQASSLREEAARLEDEVRKLRTGDREISYESAAPQASLLRRLLRAELGLSSEEAIFLCTVLNIPNREWQDAIEGLLGQNRFAILVPPAAYNSAQEIEPC